MSTNTLTERYVHEVARRIPADQRDDVADELRATIADTIEARESSDPDAAEREVLTEMGDPFRLAARYADRPLSLIGPWLYPTYIRLLTVLLSTVLPVIVVLTVVIDVLDGNDAGSVIGSGIAALLTVGAQMIAWLTVMFAVIERVQHRDGPARGADKWTPDDLPELRDLPKPDKQGLMAGAAAVWNAFLLVLIVWQHTAEPYRTDGGDRLQVLDPGLWSGWIWPILAGLAALVALELVRVAARGWTRPLAIGYALAEALFALPLAWILYRHEFFDPDFLAAVNGDWTTPDAFYTVAALGVLAVSAHEAVKRFREARR
ncbi:HAAS signaling domain-containing protein [Spirillospora sp. NBC_01491]|uniref:HAAS signaling domain-containing protein n=1 Tax=Spirillospora sp. NBC_01491 TaxID=2976007 RepID=UPI002E2F0BEC|nr:permease prefix domain 1-containing protein [Spirillospora sp. NBC_01491]